MASVKKGLSRIVEIILTIAGLVILSPFLGLGALMVIVSSKGPVLYRQERVGLHGKKFVLYKFRSMSVGASDLKVTAQGDDRVTRAGTFLRKTKIDELPELWNVLKGDMSLVGPRPEVERYVDIKNSLWAQVLAVRPGITDPVTLSLRNEEELIGQAGGSPEQFYLETLQPLKLMGYIEYQRQRDAWSDVMVIARTLFAILFPNKTPVLALPTPMVIGEESRED